MCSLDVTCMVNIPFKNGLSTFPLKMVFQPKKDKKQQQILQKIPNLNLLNNKN